MVRLAWVLVVLMSGVSASLALDGFPPEAARRLQAVLDAPPGPATLDADGTVWSCDAGEGFFQWLAATRRLPDFDATRDYWGEYKAMEAKDPTAAYGHLVTIMKGLKEIDVERWAQEYVKAMVRPAIRPAMRGLIKALQARGFQVYLVSGSNGWVVRAGARELGIDASHVIAVDAIVEDGRITDQLVQPVTWDQGKVQAIDALVGKPPVFAAGDSDGDVPMLTLATRGALCVTSAVARAPEELRWHADRKGWIWVSMP